MADVSSFEVLVEGELHSQSKSTFLWHKRNFALCSDNTFRRYSNPQRLRNSAAINALTVVTKGSRGTDFNLTFSSAISLPILRYSLRAATPHDCDVWVDVLLACIEHARASGSESDTPSPSHVSTIASVRRTNHTPIPDWAQYDDGDAAAPSRSSSAPVHLHAEPSPALSVHVLPRASATQITAAYNVANLQLSNNEPKRVICSSVTRIRLTCLSSLTDLLAVSKHAAGSMIFYCFFLFSPSSCSSPTALREL